jgi:hypothetical protein
MRLVCSGWKYHHDTMVMRVVVDELVVSLPPTKR